MTDREQLLREYVRRALDEDFGGLGGGGDYGGMGFGMGYGMGGGMVDPKDMYNTFIKPFTDVYHTAMGKTKQMATATAELLRVSTEAILTSLIPILSSDYDKIFAKYENRMDKIRSEYKGIYDSTWAAFTDNDVVLAAFAMYPTAMITQLALRKAPVPIIHTLDALTGGIFERYFEKILNILNPDPVKLSGGKSSGGGAIGGLGMGMGYYGDYGGGYGGHGGSFGEALIREDEGRKKDPADDLSRLLLRPKILDAIEANPQVNRMMKDSREAFRATLEELFDRINKVMSVRDLEQLQSVIGREIKGIERLQELPAERRRAASQRMMSSVKQAIKSLYIKNLMNQIKVVQQAGVPGNHPMITDLATAVKKIKSL